MATLLNLEIRTIVFLLFLGNLTTIAILAAYRSNFVSRRLYWQFLTGKLLQAAAWLLLGERGFIPDLLSVYAGNSLLLAGFALEAVAMLTVEAPSRRWELAYSVLTAGCLVGFWGFAVTPSLYVRVASLGTVVIYGLAALVLLRGRRESRLRLLLGVLYGLFSVILLARALATWVEPDLTLLSGNPIQSLTFSATYLLMFVGGLGFLLLLREHSDRQLMRANHELDVLSHMDSLTTLANRRAFDKALTRAVRENRRRGAPLALLMIDIDHFKNYNDLYGHGQGDECLIAVGRQIGDLCHRPNDFAARYGGEEFGVILGETDLAGALTVAENIRRSVYDLAVPHLSSGAADRVTVSVGVFSACATSDAHTEAWYIAEADRRLYAAKHAGRNQCRHGDPDLAARP